ncbi:MAG TPA: aldo/keto reductase [bacterium]|nr:aldo/keto reductase [bacterium]
MSRVQLVEDGPELSQLAYGFWRAAEWEMSTADLLQRIELCLDRGLTTFDHADIYGDYTCESIFGRALKEKPALREQMELVTKCGIGSTSPNRPEITVQHYNTSTQHIIASVENSLQNMQTEYIDVLLIHRPDPLMNADDVAEAFYSLHKDGKVLYFGVSNFTAYQCELLQSRLDFPLVTNQVELSVMNFDVLHDGTLDYCQRMRMTPMAWSPFAGGSLFTSDSAQAVRLRETLQSLGAENGGKPVDQVALAWILAHPTNIIPIIGTGKEKRLLSALDATSVEFDRQAWFRIWSASTGTDVP